VGEARGWQLWLRFAESISELKHGRNEPDVGIGTAYCTLVASSLLHENTNLFDNTQLQINLKPHMAIEAGPALKEESPTYKTRRFRNPIQGIQ
jgi:hypothetical protein